MQRLAENFRMNDVLTSFAAGLLYGPGYRPCDAPWPRDACSWCPNGASIGSWRAASIRRSPGGGHPGRHLGRARTRWKRAGRQTGDGAARHVRDAGGKLYTDDDQFFRSGVFLVSPHRAQIG